jgi:beta-lactamase class A
MRTLVGAALCLAVAGCAPRPAGVGALPAAPAVAPTQQTARLQPRPVRTPPPVPAAPRPQPPPRAATLLPLNAGLDTILPADADYAIVLEDLKSGARTAVNAEHVFPSASLYKLGVAWLALRRVDSGGLGLDAELPIEDGDAVEPEPYGGFASGDTPTVRDALHAMLSVSSNAAAHAFLRVLGRTTLGQEMDRLGLTSTRVPDDGQATTSADDIAHLLRLIASSTELTSASRTLLMQYLADGGPPDALRDTLPESIDILDKTGNLEDASNVGALLQSARGTAILVVLDSGVDPGDARGVIAQAGHLAVEALLQ